LPVLAGIVLFVMDWYRPARPPSHTLPLPGEEEPGPKGAVRGGYSPIPRRDARAGSGDGIGSLKKHKGGLIGDPFKYYYML